MYSSYPHTVPADHKRLPAFLQLLVFVPHLIATEGECAWHKQEERSGEGKVGVTHSQEVEENSIVASFEIHWLSKTFDAFQCFVECG